MSGEMEPVLSVYIPFLDNIHNGGLAFIQLYNIVMGVILGSIVGTFDAVIFLAFANITIVPAILKRDIKELHFAVKGSKLLVRDIKIKLHKIIIVHNLYNQ